MDSANSNLWYTGEKSAALANGPGPRHYPPGYAVIEDNEEINYWPGTTTVCSTDYVLGISVYYEISNSQGLVDMVSVPVGEPTALGTLPVEYAWVKGVSTGIAIVNVTNSTTQVQIDLCLGGRS